MKFLDLREETAFLNCLKLALLILGFDAYSFKDFLKIVLLSFSLAAPSVLGSFSYSKFKHLVGFED